jgi:bifunctional non-homologous end joining protein LigD
MLAVPGALPEEAGRWAYEFKWDGIRALIWVDAGRARAVSRNGHDITDSFPELRGLAEAAQADQVLLDGELVVLGPDGRASFSRLQHRMQLTSPPAVARAAATDPVSVVLFDVLQLNGRSLLDDTYDQRRAQLERLNLQGPRWAVTPAFTREPGGDVFRAAVGLGMEGVVAKRRDSVYRPGTRSANWVKVKAQRTQEVVIGGWTGGAGSRRSTFGALLLGLPTPGRPSSLTYVGKVGTGFTQAAGEELLAELGPRSVATSPFAEPPPRAVAVDPHWVRPALVGEVRFTEWTAEGRLRQPVWRGLRPDKSAGEVRREP